MELRNEISRALHAAWPEFQKREPQLAHLFDHNLVLDAAAERFADDSDYQHALADAFAREVPYQEMVMLIGRLTRSWLHSIPERALMGMWRG